MNFYLSDQAKNAMEKYGVPAHMRGGLIRYFEECIEPFPQSGPGK
jgi:hypothetical protein